MNNYTGFNFLPSPTRPAPKVRHVADTAAMPTTNTTDAVVQHGTAADLMLLPVSGEA